MVLGISLRILMFLWDISLEKKDTGDVRAVTAQEQILDPKLNDVWSLLVKEKVQTYSLFTYILNEPQVLSECQFDPKL